MSINLCRHGLYDKTPEDYLHGSFEHDLRWKKPHDYRHRPKTVSARTPLPPSM